MKTFRILATAALLSAAGAAPALADWDRIGSVDVSFQQDRDREYSSFGGGVEKLQLRVEDSDITCRFIRATFGNNDTRQVFSGRLQQGNPVMVDLPGGARIVRRLDFSCHSDRPRGGTINIYADVGRYRQDWRSSPDWTRTWSRMFNWTDNRGYDNRMDNWVTLGTESFEGRHDSETSFGGWRGTRVDRIGLRPSTDAVCTRVRVTLDNHTTHDLNLGQGGYLRRGDVKELDLPGRQRNILRLELRCHAQNDNRVEIQILARK